MSARILNFICLLLLSSDDKKIQLKFKYSIEKLFLIQYLMLQHKKLSKILKYKANLITFFRLILLLASTIIFPRAPVQACSMLMINVVLDYADGIVARRYNECSVFGESIDWMVDITSSVLMYLWWVALEPHLIFMFLALFAAETSFMIIDIMSKAAQFSPIIRANDWITYILRITLEPGKPGYSCQGLGYINQVNYYLCGISRILFVISGSQFWYWSFLVNLIPAASYVLMNIAYSKNILDCWQEKKNSIGKAEIIFIEPIEK